jgi:hypothetical protein
MAIKTHVPTTLTGTVTATLSRSLPGRPPEAWTRLELGDGEEVDVRNLSDVPPPIGAVIACSVGRDGYTLFHQ